MVISGHRGEHRTDLCLHLKLVASVYELTPDHTGFHTSFRGHTGIYRMPSPYWGGVTQLMQMSSIHRSLALIFIDAKANNRLLILLQVQDFVGPRQHFVTEG